MDLAGLHLEVENVQSARGPEALRQYDRLDRVDHDDPRQADDHHEELPKGENSGGIVRDETWGRFTSNQELNSWKPHSLRTICTGLGNRCDLFVPSTQASANALKVCGNSPPWK